jgi:hypothetical protein
VVDLLDLTTNNMWTTVAMSNTGEDRELVIRYCTLHSPEIRMCWVNICIFQGSKRRAIAVAMLNCMMFQESAGGPSLWHA